MACLSRGPKLALLVLALAGCGCLAGNFVAVAGEKPGKGSSDQAGKLTAANYKKLKNGMTEKQVVGILGKPTSTSPQDHGELGTGTVLSWRSPNAAIAVLFRDGKAIAHKGAFGKDALAMTPKLSPKTFDRVKFDMTEKEVIAILGPPTEAKSPAGMPNVRILVWRSGKNSATITFQDGKVSASEAKFSD
jgi:outer membrane protein assembly factor BamE (lipoprotein component of BamABCDE complex)